MSQNKTTAHQFCSVTPNDSVNYSGLSLRSQVAGYLLLVAGEVASSHGGLILVFINDAEMSKRDSRRRMQK